MDVRSTERAVVFGGGGSAGNAWEIGVVAGLFDAGIDVRSADLIVGTSAGSTVAAQITSGTGLMNLFADIVDAVPPSRPSPSGPERGRAPLRPLANHMEVSSAAIDGATDAADMRRRMGAAALGFDTESRGEAQAQWRATVAARLPNQLWPNQQLLVTVVDAETGEPAVFDRNSGVELADAVAASCTSVGSGLPPYGIGARRYIDGGYRRNENADLAAGFSRVLVLSPFGGRSRHPADWGMDLATQIRELEAGGSRVEAIFPDIVSREVFGGNMMNPASRPPAARAGFEQGAVLAERLSDFWGR